MLFEKIKSPGLAHISYLIGDKNEAVVIDPRRDIDIYLDKAVEKGYKITKVLETHRNEDYVIGSLEIADNVDIEIYHGPGLDWKFGNVFNEGD